MEAVVFLPIADHLGNGDGHDGEGGIVIIPGIEVDFSIAQDPEGHGFHRSFLESVI